jgi:hypothetical protein
VGSEYRYRLGSRYDSYRHASRFADLQFGHSSGLIGGHARRLTVGWRVEHDEFSTAPDGQTLAPIPANRALNYPYVQLEWLTDEFKTTRNLEQIDRTEDLQFGFSALARLGWSTPAFGADRKAVVASALLQNGWQLSAMQTLFVSIDYNARLESGSLIDARTSGSASWYWRTTERSLLNIKLTGATGGALDLDHYFELGGDNGLRGYPLRYQMGSARGPCSRLNSAPTATIHCGSCWTSAARLSSTLAGCGDATPYRQRRSAGYRTSASGCAWGTGARHLATSSTSISPLH